MIIIPVDLDPTTGIPMIPDEIKQRVRNGERISIEILSQVNGFAKNAIRHGVAGLNIEGGRIGESGARNNGRQRGTNGIYGEIGATVPVDYGKGRWPANVILNEEAAALLDEQSGTLTSGKPLGRMHTDVDGRNTYGSYHGEYEHTGFGDSGGASRFFYVAKASRSERNAGLEGMPERDAPQTYGLGDLGNGKTTAHANAPAANHHPTVKPVKLLLYLCRLTATPTGGTVLDPFCGSGSTGVACMRTGRHFVGIDISAEYIEIAQRRIEAETQRIEAETRQPTLFEV